jgi:hypothetical protein
MALPEVTTHQDRLLTININDATPPAMDGVSLTPLFLDRENGVWVLYGKFAPGTVDWPLIADFGAPQTLAPTVESAWSSEQGQGPYVWCARDHACIHRN